MPSQLRLRAIASDAATARNSAAAPIASGRGRRHAAPPTASDQARDVMRSIQARIDERREAGPPRMMGNDEINSRESQPKRTRREELVVGQVSTHRKPVLVQVDAPLPSQDRVPALGHGVAGPNQSVGVQPANAAVDTRDGRTKLYVGGFEFTRSSITRIKIVYRCSFYRSQACAAKLEFYAAMMDYDFANMVPHSCTPPSRRVPSLDPSTKTMIVKAAMQREVDNLAVGSAETPQVIWDQVSAKFYDRDDNVVVRGMSKAQVTKRVHRTRALHFGSDLHGRVEVPPLSRVKLTSLNFFQFHHVWTNPSAKNEYKIDRLVGWAHPGLLNLLRYGKISLFIDGTFRCVPHHFRQCVVLMVYDQGTKLYVPVFYVLAASKTYDAYWNILQYIRDACGERLDPKQVVCDFEMALIKAVGDWFPDIDIVGCFFHFKQACSRKMAKLHIPALEIKIAMEKGCLDMLTVVDPAKLEKQGIAWVRARIEERCGEEGISFSTTRWLRFWTYFKKTWLKLLPPTVWNVHGLRRDLVGCTNNPLERFNRELNAAFGTPHPSVVRFVQTVEEISRRYAKLREDIVRGIASPPRRDALPELPTPVQLPDLAEESDDSEQDTHRDFDEEEEDSDSDIKIEANYANASDSDDGDASEEVVCV